MMRSDNLTWRTVEELLDVASHQPPVQLLAGHAQALPSQAKLLGVSWPYYIPQHLWSPEAQRHVAREQKLARFGLDGCGL